MVLGAEFLGAKAIIRAQRLPAARRLVVQGGFFIVAGIKAASQLYCPMLSSCFKLSSGEVTLAIYDRSEKEWPKKGGKKRRKVAARPLFKLNGPVPYASVVVVSPRCPSLQPAELASVAARMMRSGFAARSSNALMRWGSTAGGRGGGA